MQTIVILVYSNYKFGKGTLLSQAAFAWNIKSAFVTSVVLCRAFARAATSWEKNSLARSNATIYRSAQCFAEYVCACYKCALYEALGAITVSAVSASFIVPAPNLWVSASSAVRIFLASSVYERLNNPTLAHTQSCLTPFYNFTHGLDMYKN